MDDLEEAAYEHFGAIRTLYERFADKSPVMLFDVQEQRVYAYPYHVAAVSDLGSSMERWSTRT